MDMNDWPSAERSRALNLAEIDRDSGLAIGWDGRPYGIGDRVEISPGYDLWMRGARYGEVVGLSITLNDRVKVRLDRLPGQKVAGPGDNFRKI